MQRSQQADPDLWRCFVSLSGKLRPDAASCPPCAIRRSHPPAQVALSSVGVRRPMHLLESAAARGARTGADAEARLSCPFESWPIPCLLDEVVEGAAKSENSTMMMFHDHPAQGLAVVSGNHTPAFPGGAGTVSRPDIAGWSGELESPRARPPKVTLHLGQSPSPALQSALLLQPKLSALPSERASLLHASLRRRPSPAIR